MQHQDDTLVFSLDALHNYSLGDKAHFYQVGGMGKSNQTTRFREAGVGGSDPLILINRISKLNDFCWRKPVRYVS